MAKTFKLLFDGKCPFCQREIRWLERMDKKNALEFEDIASLNFDPARYGKTRDELMGVIHGVLPDGRLVTKMEVFRQAYSAVGLGWLVAPTGWPVLRWVFDGIYVIFARNRVQLGRLFGRSCDSGTCQVHSKKD